MVKGHITGCGLHGYSLVVYVLFNRSILLLVFKYFFLVSNLVLFICLFVLFCLCILQLEQWKTTSSAC